MLLEKTTAEVRQAQSEREEIRGKIFKIERDSLELGFMLADIKRKGYYIRWGFPSFNQWVSKDLSTPGGQTYLSKSYIYCITKIGEIFYEEKDRIKAVVADKKATIRNLYDAAYKIEMGADKRDVLKYLETGERSESLKVDVGGEDRSVVRIVHYVKKPDYRNFMGSLYMHAVLNGYDTAEKALTDLVMTSLIENANLFRDSAPAVFRQYEDLIVMGKFNCKFCKKIPNLPTQHHLLPQSICKGWGRTVLLCLNCHSLIQPRWKQYCAEWWGDPEELIRKHEELVREYGGAIPEEKMERGLIL